MNYKIENYNGEDKKVATFPGKLLSVGSTPLTNKNGKEYFIGTIEFEDENNQKHQCNTTIYKGSYVTLDGEIRMQVGQSYLTKATFVEGSNPFVQTSHLTSAEFATNDMFDFSKAIAKVTEEAAQKELANS